MSYYSTIGAFEFRSRFTEAELKEAFNRFVQNLTGEERDCMGIYEFSRISGPEKDGLYEYALEMGEDGEKWGYLVLSNEVHDLAYETLVNGKPLHEFIDEKTKGKENSLEETNKQETKR